MSTRPRNQLAVVAAVLTFAVAGCTGDTIAGTGTGSVQTTTQPSAPTITTPTTTPRPYATTTPTLELTDEATKPGTKLKFGEQAIVPFYSTYAKGLLGITVTVESVKATEEEIDKLPLKDEDKGKLKGKMFFFVKQTLVDIDGANFEGVTSPYLQATTRSGGFPGTLLGVGNHDVTGCEAGSLAPSDFSVKGAKFEDCRLAFGTASDPIASLAFTTKPYESAATKAVTWRSK